MAMVEIRTLLLSVSSSISVNYIMMSKGIVRKVKLYVFNYIPKFAEKLLLIA